jgi:hypothetical protein
LNPILPPSALFLGCLPVSFIICNSSNVSSPYNLTPFNLVIV